MSSDQIRNLHTPLTLDKACEKHIDWLRQCKRSKYKHFFSSKNLSNRFSTFLLLLTPFQRLIWRVFEKLRVSYALQIWLFLPIWLLNICKKIYFELLYYLKVSRCNGKCPRDSEKLVFANLVDVYNIGSW